MLDARRFQKDVDADLDTAQMLVSGTCTLHQRPGAEQPFEAFRRSSTRSSRGSKKLARSAHGIRVATPGGTRKIRYLAVSTPRPTASSSSRQPARPVRGHSARPIDQHRLYVSDGRLTGSRARSIPRYAVLDTHLSRIVVVAANSVGRRSMSPERRRGSTDGRLVGLPAAHREHHQQHAKEVVVRSRVWSATGMVHVITPATSRGTRPRRLQDAYRSGGDERPAKNGWPLARHEGPSDSCEDSVHRALLAAVGGVERS